MIEDLKIILNTTDEDLLAVLIKDCKQYAVDYCNLDEYTDKLDTVVKQMVSEKFNTSAGIGSRSYGSLSESYLDDFSKTVYNALRKFRKLRTA